MSAAGRNSRGPRFRDAQARLPAGEFTTFTIADADSYFDAAAAQGIQLDRQHRRSLIAAAVQKAAANAREFKTAGTEPLPPGIYEWEPDEDLLDEVTDLVEAPQAVLGSFEQRFPGSAATDPDRRDEKAPALLPRSGQILRPRRHAFTGSPLCLP